MWQEVIVGSCVLIALIYVLRQWLPGLGKKSQGCGGCGGCATNANSCQNPNEKGQH